MKIENKRISDLNPAPYNPRKDIKPGTKAWDDLNDSLKRFGMVQPVVWNQRSGRIVGGHQRLTMLIHQGFTHTEVSVVDLDDNEEKALNVILNKLGEGNWHNDKLADLLQGIEGIDLERLGFTKKELSDIFRKHKAKHRRDPDTPVTIPLQPRVKRSDFFELISADGTPQHRVLCGDATDIGDMQRLVGNASPRLVFTYPPYGVSYESKSKKGGKMKKKEIENDDIRSKVLQEFLTKIFANAAAVSHGEAALYTWYASRTHIQFETALLAGGWTVRQQLIWKKQMVLGRSDYHWSHEPCLYAMKKGSKIEWYGTRSETTVLDTEAAWEAMDKKALIGLLAQLRNDSTLWEIARDPTASYIHPTQKPIALARRAIRNNTLQGDTVLDCCAGSGSTMIAAEEEGRSSLICEFDPAFAEAIVSRYADTYQDVAIVLNGKEQKIENWRTKPWENTPQS